MNDEKLNEQNADNGNFLDESEQNRTDFIDDQSAYDDQIRNEKDAELSEAEEKDDLFVTLPASDCDAVTITPVPQTTEDDEGAENIASTDVEKATQKEEDISDNDGETATETQQEGEEPQPASLYETAKLFGVSEEKLVGEFNAYKASKLFKRINWLIIDPKTEGEKLKRNIESAVLLGIESVTVFPVNLESAKKYAGDRLNVRVAAFYPFGAETLKARIKFIKTASRLKPSAIEMPIFLGELIKKGPQKTAKEWAKLKKKAGKTELIAVTDFDILNEEEKSAVLAMVKRAGIEKIKTSTCVLSDGVSDLTPGNRSGLFENVKFEIAIKNPTAEDLLKAFGSGADTISSIDVESAVKDVKKLLGCK